jgi:hypothetical protein
VDVLHGLCTSATTGDSTNQRLLHLRAPPVHHSGGPADPELRAGQPLSSVTVPTIKLVGPSLVTLKKGTVYNACPAGLTPASICDRGVAAADAGGRSLAANVTACAEHALPGGPLVRPLAV